MAEHGHTWPGRLHRCSSNPGSSLALGRWWKNEGCGRRLPIRRKSRHELAGRKGSNPQTQPKSQLIERCPLAGVAKARFVAQQWSNDGRAVYSRSPDGVFPDFYARLDVLALVHGFHVADGEPFAQACSVLVDAICLMRSNRLLGTGFDFDPQHIGQWDRKDLSDMCSDWQDCIEAWKWTAAEGMHFHIGDLEIGLLDNIESNRAVPCFSSYDDALMMQADVLSQEF